MSQKPSQLQRAGRLLLLFGSPNMQNLHHLQPNKPWQRTHVVLYNEHTLNDQLHQNMHDLAHELEASFFFKQQYSSCYVAVAPLKELTVLLLEVNKKSTNM